MSEITITKEELSNLVDPDVILKAIEIVESKVESLKSKPVTYRVFFNLFKVNSTLYKQYENEYDRTLGLIGEFHYFAYKGGDLTFKEWIVADTEDGGDPRVTRLLRLALNNSVDKYSKVAIPVKDFNRLERLIEFSEEIVSEHEKRE